MRMQEKASNSHKMQLIGMIFSIQVDSVLAQCSLDTLCLEMKIVIIGLSTVTFFAFVGFIIIAVKLCHATPPQTPNRRPNSKKTKIKSTRTDGVVLYDEIDEAPTIDASAKRKEDNRNKYESVVIKRKSEADFRYESLVNRRHKSKDIENKRKSRRFRLLKISKIPARENEYTETCNEYLKMSVCMTKETNQANTGKNRPSAESNDKDNVRRCSKDNGSQSDNEKSDSKEAVNVLTRGENSSITNNTKDAYDNKNSNEQNEIKDSNNSSLNVSFEREKKDGQIEIEGEVTKIDHGNISISINQGYLADLDSKISPKTSEEFVQTKDFDKNLLSSTIHNEFKENEKSNESVLKPATINRSNETKAKSESQGHHDISEMSRKSSGVVIAPNRKPSDIRKAFNNINQDERWNEKVPSIKEKKLTTQENQLHPNVILGNTPITEEKEEDKKDYINLQL